MRCIHFSRGDFAQSFADQTRAKGFHSRLSHGDPRHQPDPRSLWACWSDDEDKIDSMPRLVIVSDGDVDDFLAWAVTFVSAVKPLTSFMRVLSWSVYSQTRDCTRDSVKLGAPLVGAILGEAMMHAGDRRAFETLAMAAFESTFAATLAKTIVRGLGPDLFEHTSENWRRAREITAQPIRKGDPEALEDVLSVVLNLENPYASHQLTSARGREIQEGCLEIRSTGHLSSSMWQNISGGRYLDPILGEAMNGSKERRVQAFEEVVQSLVRDVTDEFSTSFLIGYLASRVSEGSLEHAHLVLPLQEILPMVISWYGVCSALLPGSRVLTDYGYLGLRILRMIASHEELLDSPSCDIAVDELEVILRGDARSWSFRQVNAAYLRVEVAPTVTTVVKWPQRSNPVSQMSLFASEERSASSEQYGVQELIANLRASLALAEGMIKADTQRGESKAVPRRGKRRR